MSRQRCPHCGLLTDLTKGESFAFCVENPNREQALARWRAGDKRYRAKSEKIVLTAIVVPPSPFTPKAKR